MTERVPIALCARSIEPKDFLLLKKAWVDYVLDLNWKRRKLYAVD